MTPKLFSELGLSAEVLKAIDKLGFEQASPIQAAAIPLLMQGKDIVGQSQTGSGKTAAFGVPAIEKVDLAVRAVQVLVLCPTRELAVQVSEEVHKLALFKRGIQTLPIYGGQSYERQYYGLKQGAQIVIGTPGRVMDHMRRGTLKLDRVKLVVLDEADEMLDMGFREDIETILQAVPAERQTVFFAATMPRPIQELIQKFSREPQHVRMEQKTMTVPTVEQIYYEVGWGFKLELLTRLIDLHDLQLGIIFCNTKRAVDELVDHLNAQGYSADRLHGDMNQAMRDRVMGKFRKSGLEFLVATDVAARGIDVDDVQVVFNYDMPYDPEDYVHRVGRTGRAGRSGLAVSFVSGRELFRVQQIERFTRVRMKRARVPTLAEVEEARAGQVVDQVRAALQAGEFKRQDHVVELLLEEGFTSTDIISAMLHVLGGGEQEVVAKPARPGRGPEATPTVRAETRAEAPAPAVPAVPVAPAKVAEPKVAVTKAAAVQEPVIHAASSAANEAVERELKDAAVECVPTQETRREGGNTVEGVVAADLSVEREAEVKVPVVEVPVEVPTPVEQEKPVTHSAAQPAKLAPPRATPPRPVAPRPERAAPIQREARRATAPTAARPAMREQGAMRSGPPRRPFAPVPREGREPARSPGFGRGEELRPQRMERAAGPRPPLAAAAPPAPVRAQERAERRGPPSKVPPWMQRNRPEAQGGEDRKASRRTPTDQTRLFVNVGSEMGVEAGDVVGAILGETGLPASVVGVVDIRERHLFVDVAGDSARAIISKLNRSQIKGRKVKVKVA